MKNRAARTFVGMLLELGIEVRAIGDAFYVVDETVCGLDVARFKRVIAAFSNRDYLKNEIIAHLNVVGRVVKTAPDPSTSIN